MKKSERAADSRECCKNRDCLKEIEIKKIVSADAKTISQLKKFFPKWGKNSLAEKKLKKTLDGKNFRFAALLNGKLVAHVKITPKKDAHSHVAEVTSLFVLLKCRRTGVATKLILAAEKKMPKKIEILTLWADPKNGGAMKFYKKIGFKKCGFLKNASKKGKKYSDGCLLQKNI
jgi:ribosomal protein S18 acetylase RimI-like enzyme